mmetsp:Transcript_25855/g.56665  ORF Transcript_25855/g.56665 Transcript_25855/m.56665 type:complete len:275 (+) Transcript_25855:32-856(+)
MAALYLHAALVVLAHALGDVTLPEAVTEAVRGAQEAAGAANLDADRAQRSIGRVEVLSKSLPDLSTKAEDAEKRAEAGLKEAEAAQKQAEDLLKTVEETSYAAASKSARKELKRLETDAENHYKSYLSDMKLSRVPPVDHAAQVEELKKAEKPYVDAEQKVEATVESYNSLAISLANEVIMYTDKAKKLADTAVQEQATGSAVLAAKHMLEATKLMHMAKEKKVRALKVRALAERLNSQVLPSYKQAVDIAGLHASFSGLQTSQQRHRLLRKKT